MNCPTCEQAIAADHHRLGPWRPEADDDGKIVGCSRRIAIHCEHCGYFEAEEDATGFMRSVHGPYQSAGRIRRVARQLASRTLSAIRDPQSALREAAA